MISNDKTVYSKQFQPRLIRGIVMVDIILALALSTVFVAIITESAISSRDIFEEAKIRGLLLEMYDAGTTTVQTSLYGNDLYEQEIIMSTSSKSLVFLRIMKPPSFDPSRVVGRPFCSVDYSNDKTLGSYEYFQSHNDPRKPNTLLASITPIMLSIDPLLPLIDMEVRNDIAYVSTDSSVSLDPDLVIVNINNPTQPIIISSLNTGPGLSSISVAFDRVYAAARSTAAQLHIIRLDDLDSPILEKKYKLPLPYATATPPFASSIFYQDNKVYLGTEKWDGDEFNVLDVSNPSLPIKLSGFETGSKVNDIFVNGGYAYIAASDQNQLRVIDVHDPTNLTLVNFSSSSGWQRQEGKVISYFEDSLGFGRTSGGFNFTTDHESFEWASTSSTTLTNSVSTDIPSGVYGILKDRYRVYLATRQVNKEFQIFDRTLNASSSISYSLPVAPQMMTCDGNNIYILAHNAPFIYQIKLR